MCACADVRADAYIDQKFDVTYSCKTQVYIFVTDYLNKNLSREKKKTRSFDELCVRACLRMCV